MIFSIGINAQELDVEEQDGMYCLEEEELIEVANHISDLEKEVELLNDRIDTERQRYEDLLKSKEETITLQEELISEQKEQIKDLTLAVDKKDEQLELQKEVVDLERRKIKMTEAQNIITNASLIAVIGIIIFK